MTNTSKKVEIPDPNNPVEVVKAFDAALNAGDVEKALACFSAEAYIKSPGDPVITTGTEQIRQWIVNLLDKFHVDSTNHRLTGDSVVWDGRLRSEFVSQMGLSALSEVAEAVVRGGKIISLSIIIVGAIP